MAKIIKYNKSMIPSCDVSTLEELGVLVSETCNVKGIGAYKVGFEIVIPYGAEKVVQTIREFTDIPIIYDHQKAGTDIPEMGAKFMKACKKFDAVIIFPQAGPVTEEEWIKAAKKDGMNIIVGGEMTHKGYLSSDGGFIDDIAPKKIYTIAKKLGVKDFVVPGNKPEKILEYRKMLGEDAVFYSPGLITQGGDLSESAKAAGKYWHAIVGRALYNSPNRTKAAEEMVKKLVD